MAALSIGAECPFPAVLNGGYPTHRQPPSPPEWAQKMGVQAYEKIPPLYLKKDRGDNFASLILAVLRKCIMIVSFVFSFISQDKKKKK